MKGVSSNGGSVTPRARTLRRRALDAAIFRIFKMPAGHHDYTVTQARVPMRDGVELLTDVYAPVANSLGTVLIRTPLRPHQLDRPSHRPLPRDSRLPRCQPELPRHVRLRWGLRTIQS